MEYFHTNYDASTMTVSVNDEEVSRALGVLSNKTPAALKVAVNTTARQTRKLMLTEVKNRYDLNAAGRRMIEDLRQRQSDQPPPDGYPCHHEERPRRIPGRPGLFQNQPHKALHGSVCSQCAACFSGTRSERQSDDRSERNR